MTTNLFSISLDLASFSRMFEQSQYTSTVKRKQAVIDLKE
jgi:hypothetical protein